MYGSWINNKKKYLCNQGLSPLTLWVRTPCRWDVLNATLCDKACQWLATGRWFSPGTPVSSITKINRHGNIVESGAKHHTINLTSFLQGVWHSQTTNYALDSSSKTIKKVNISFCGVVSYSSETKSSYHNSDGFPQGVNQTYQKRKILPVIFLCSGKTKMNKTH